MTEELSFILMNGIGCSGRNRMYHLIQSIFSSCVNITTSLNIGPICENNILCTHCEIDGIHPLHLHWEKCTYFLENKPHLFKNITILRDPRDNFISCYNFVKTHGGWPEGSILTYLKNQMPHIEKNIRYFLPMTHYPVLFEQLAFKPVETLTNLINFMGYPLDMAAIENAVQTIPRTGKVGQWVNFFDDEIEATFKELGGDIVSYLGYEPDENWSYKEYQGKENMTEEEYWNMKPRLLGI